MHLAPWMLSLISSVSSIPPGLYSYSSIRNMTGAGAGCAGPVQSYPASWPNSHYYQGGSTSAPCYIDICLCLCTMQNNFSIRYYKNDNRLIKCPLAHVHNHPRFGSCNRKNRPRLRAAADRLHPGQHDGCHGGKI